MLSAPISVATSGDQQIIAGVVGKKIRVVNFVIVAAAAVNVKVASGPSSGSTNLTGVMTMATGVPIQSGYSSVRGNGSGYDGHFDTNAQGDNLYLNLSGNVQVSGWINYVLVA